MSLLNGEISFKKLGSLPEFAELEVLAREIWEEHYIPIIGEPQVRYMMKKFQTPEAMSKQSEEEKYQFYFVVQHGHRVGYLSYQMREEGLFLSKFYLLKKYRGRGISRMMLSFLDERAESAGAEKIYLTVNKHNERALTAYRALGFYNDGSVVIDIGGGFVMDDFRMVKKLPAGFD